MTPRSGAGPADGATTTQLQVASRVAETRFDHALHPKLLQARARRSQVPFVTWIGAYVSPPLYTCTGLVNPDDVECVGSSYARDLGSRSKRGLGGGMTGGSGDSRWRRTTAELTERDVDGRLGAIVGEDEGD